MPDFEHAVILLAVVAAFVEVAKIMVGARLAANHRALVGLVLVASFAAVFVLRYSLWAHSQVIEGKPLDAIPTTHLVTAAVILWLGEVGIFLVSKKAGVGLVRGLSNMGTPLPTEYDPKYGEPIEKPVYMGVPAGDPTLTTRPVGGPLPPAQG